MKKLPRIQVAEGKMCEVQILNIPSSISLWVAAYGLPEERQFEAEALAIDCRQVTRVIPPLSLIVGMTEVIVRKFIPISGKSGFVLCGCWLTQREAGEQAREANPHGRPQEGSVVPPLARGISLQGLLQHKR